MRKKGKTNDYGWWFKQYETREKREKTGIMIDGLNRMRERNDGYHMYTTR